MMRRRRFLEGCGHGLAGLLAASAGLPGVAAGGAAGREIAADVVIIGGGLGGCAAALAALRAGRTVVLTEPTDWIGGQLTSQAVPPDEHPWIEQFGANASYRELRQGIRDYYRRHYPLTAEARAARSLQPRQRRRVEALPRAEGRAGGPDGHARTLCVERPAARACSSTSRSRADVQGDRVRAVVVRDRRTGRERSLAAPYFLDATELGDLLPMAGVEFVDRRRGPGPAPASRTPPSSDQPDNQQAITCCFAVEYLDGRGPHHRPARRVRLLARLSSPRCKPAVARTAARPDLLRSDDAQARQPRLRPARRRASACGSTDESSTPATSSPAPIPAARGSRWSTGRRTTTGSARSPVPGSRPTTPRRHIARAKQLSLSLLYWLQTECPRPDGKTGWKGLKLRPDLVGTDDGLAKAPYVRESRRIQAEFTVLEQHVGTEARRSKIEDSRTSRPSRSPTASASAAIGSTCTPAPAATTTSTSARCRSRSRWAP